MSRLDTCVTVVDAANFYTNFHSVSPANAEDVEDERTVVDLMVEQLEFATFWTTTARSSEINRSSTQHT